MSVWLSRALLGQVSLPTRPGRALSPQDVGPVAGPNRPAVEVPAVPPDEIAARPAGDTSQAIRARVVQARERQLARQDKPNALLSTREIDKYAAPDPTGEQILKQAISRLGLSARGYHRVLKVARTIADLAGVEMITAAQIAEAVQYRRLETN